VQNNSSTASKVGTAIAAATLMAASYFLPSPQAVRDIQEHEGTKLIAYADPVGIPTICTGATLNVRLGQVATKSECDNMLVRDLTYAGKGVAHGVTHRITQGQYDALVSFVFNIGETQFYKSTLLRKINAGDCYGASKEFGRWVYAKGILLRGLVIRRAQEASRFEEGCYLWTK
jgi:lysozyme